MDTLITDPPTAADCECFAKILYDFRKMLDEEKHRDLIRFTELERMEYCLLAMANSLSPMVTERQDSAEATRSFYVKYNEARETRINKEQQIN